MSIEKRLRQVIDEQNTSVKAFAESLDVPLRTLHNYLSGECEPSADFLMKISTQININLNWLLLEKGNIYLDHQSELSLNSDEKMLLDQYRATTDSGKKILRSISQLITNEFNLDKVIEDP